MAQNPDPSTVARTCLMQAVRKASRAITARYERALAPANLSAGQFTLMTALAVAEAPSVAELGRRIGADRTTVSRLIRPLVRRALVGVGERAGSLALTPEGRRLYASALSGWSEAQADLTRELGDSATATLRTTLQRL